MFKFIAKNKALPFFIRRAYYSAFGIELRRANGDYFTHVLSAVGLKCKRTLDYYIDELLYDDVLRSYYELALDRKLIKDKYAGDYGARIAREGNLVNYYALVRELEPRILVETGTATGSMTSWILSALHKNQHGKLISIDIPPEKGKLTMDMSISREQVGFLIPHAYRQNWEYVEGDAKLFLQDVLINNNVDVFIHDSLHTYDHMMFEYVTARGLMKKDTVIMSDDILWNNAWTDFVRGHKLNAISCEDSPNLGLLVNR